MYFLPSDEFQIREKRFINFAASDERHQSYISFAGTVNERVLDDKVLITRRVDQASEIQLE